MRQTDESIQAVLDQLDLKFRIDSLLFDIHVDQTLFSSQVTEIQSVHNHSLFELHVIEAGTGLMCVGNKEHRVAAGDILLIAPNVFHFMMPVPDEIETVKHFTLRFGLRSDDRHELWFPVSEAAQIRETLSKVTFFQFPECEHSHEVAQIMKAIQQEVAAPSACAYACLQGLGVQLIVRLIRLIRAMSADSNGMVVQQLPQKMADEQRSRIIDLFFKQYRKPLTLAMLASQLYVSPKQLNRLIQQDYRTTFKQKLLDTRVERAKYLLCYSELPIEQIAKEVGYASPDNFSRIFKRKTGKTPSEYRRSAYK